MIRYPFHNVLHNHISAIIKLVINYNDYPLFEQSVRAPDPDILV